MRLPDDDWMELQREIEALPPDVRDVLGDQLGHIRDTAAEFGAPGLAGLITLILTGWPEVAAAWMQREIDDELGGDGGVS